MSSLPLKRYPHHALLDVDVIDMVLQHFYGCSDDTPTLIAAIRVHSSWTIPAARWLWRDISGIRWLFEIISPLKAGKKGLELTGHSTPSATGERIRFYARHIHTIGYADWRHVAKKDYSPSPISPEAFEHISAAASSNGPLFPSLRALCWTTYTLHHNKQVHFLASAAASPHLNTLFLQTTSRNPIPAGLGDLPIKTLELFVWEESLPVPGVVEAGMMVATLGAFIGTRRCLTRLSVGQGCTRQYSADRRERDVSYRAFVRRPLDVDFFHISWGGRRNTFDRSIVPLLRCSDLVEFRFTGAFSRSLTEEDFRVMASASPSLTTLALHDGRRYTDLREGHRPILSLSLLPALGRSMPRLLSLSVTLSVDTPSPQDLVGCPFQRLRELDLGNTYIYRWQIKEAARALAEICPINSKIAATGWCDKRWERVAAEVAVIWAGRPEARIN